LPGGFVAPSFRVPGTLRFSRNALFAASARAAALRPAPIDLLLALEVATGRMTSVIVDEGGVIFELKDGIRDLADFERNSFVGRIAAGVTDLLMNELGYIWRANASEAIPTREALGDFLYTGGPVGRQVVLAESKGTAGVRATANSIRRKVTDAYERQVRPHVGEVTPLGQIVHGYAVALSIFPNSPAFVHVAETERPASRPPVPASAVASGEISIGVESANVVLSALSADFKLIRAPGISAELAEMRGLSSSLGASLGSQTLQRVRIGRRTFLTEFRDQDLQLTQQIRYPTSRSGFFAIDETVAEAALGAVSAFSANKQRDDNGLLSAFVDNRTSDQGEPFAQSTVGVDVEDGIVLFSDGLAYITKKLRRRRDDVRQWTSKSGLE
jgi:hypothetical protein